MNAFYHIEHVHVFLSLIPESIEAQGDAPLRALLDTLGGWPVLDPSWDETNFDWIELMAKLKLLNNKVLINNWVGADDRDSSVNIIQVLFIILAILSAICLFGLRRTHSTYSFLDSWTSLIWVCLAGRII